MKWIKPSGLEIETNDDKATIDHCRSLGWNCEVEAFPDIHEKEDDSFESNPSTSGAITQEEVNE